MRKSKIKIIIGILLLTCMMLIAAIVIIAIGHKTVEGYRAQMDAMQNEMMSNRQTVYVATTDIQPGEILEEYVNVAEQEVYTGLSSASFINYDDIGGIARIMLPMGEPIMKNSVTKLQVTKDTRKYEMSVANLMTNQAEFDYVDVRIMFPNGEDYTVLSKKPVYDLNLENCIFYTYLDEDEIMRMASATIDAYTVTGTRIYTTKYVESALQSAAVPNYLVKAETLDLIASDPNITAVATETLNLRARLDLEARLSGLSEDQLKAVSEGHELTDTAKNSVLLSSNYNLNDGEVELEDSEESEDEDIDNPEPTTGATVGNASTLGNTIIDDGNTTSSSLSPVQGFATTPTPAAKDVIE